MGFTKARRVKKVTAKSQIYAAEIWKGTHSAASSPGYKLTNQSSSSAVSRCHGNYIAREAISGHFWVVSYLYVSRHFFQ